MQRTCACNSSVCDGADAPKRVSRRGFLQAAGGGAAAVAATGPWTAFAGPFDQQDTVDHFIPVDKKLSAEWVKALFARGQRTWHMGQELETIGMPIGGVCAGQVYLTGDGRLVYWDIFNGNLDSGYGQVNYKNGRKPTEMVTGRQRFAPAPQVDQGFAVRVGTGDSAVVRSLDATGFADVRFRGEYPIGHVEYVDKAFPVEVKLEAFSPFIPLNAADSALPATVLNYTIKNTQTAPVQVTLAGWLQNAVCHFSAAKLAGSAVRSSRVIRGDGSTTVIGGVKPVEQQQKPARPPVVFADFEGGDYGQWKMDGDAFGKAPAQGTLARQQPVSGFQGKGLVNTYLGGDDKLTGRLVSPAFTIERPYISFLVGGGNEAGATCVNLVVDGKTVRTATGERGERLTPHNWSVRDLIGKTARIEIVDAATGPWGHINVDQIAFRDTPLVGNAGDLSRLPDYGSMALTLLGQGDSLASASLPVGDAARVVFDGDGFAAVEPVDRAMDQPLRGAVGRTILLEPGDSQTLTFVVSWCMPNMYRGNQWVGNYYAKRFRNAADVADYIAKNFDRLAGHTRLWRDTYYDATLPWWLLDRIGATTCNLATNTCQRWRSGRFWAWEGVGCCHGTCGHVWNYEHAMARLFPELERSVREMQDFAPGIGFNAESGSIGFRGEGWSLWAGDSQGGYVLKAYREHQCSPDGDFLKRNWPRIKRATQFLIGQDGNADGLLEGRQHQTYDQDYYGANTMVGSLYLGALRAAEQMAREIEDVPFAEQCGRIFEAGSKNSVERLFNEEYYIQDVDLKKHPDWQYADGCLADQMFGQGWAHQVGLGYLYPKNTVLQSLQSIWKYCWAPDINAQNKNHKPERWFALPGEAGLFTCTWPKSKHLGPKSTRYRNEVWTGIEYQVANHMAWEGMLTEALAICRAVHDRYHPAKRNPYNEIECGDHYARAMASWGVLTALAGFEHHGPRERLGFAPRITPDDFRSVFTAAEGWGTIAQKRDGDAQSNTIVVTWGRLRVATLAFELPKGVAPGQVVVEVDGKSLRCTPHQEDRRVTITLSRDAVVEAGQTLTVTFNVSKESLPCENADS